MKCIRNLVACAMLTVLGIVGVSAVEPGVYKEGWLTVCVLEGSYNDMGTQYAKYLSKPYSGVYKILVGGIMEQTGITESELIDAVAKPALVSMPARQKALLQGVASGVNMSLEQVALLDQINYVFEDVALGQLSGSPGKPEASFACSYLAVSGDYTKDGQLLLGRNLDWISSFRELSNELVLVVMRPNDGSRSVAALQYIGQISNILTGMNDKGLFVEINVGHPFVGQTNDRVPLPNDLMRFLLDSDSYESLYAQFMSTRSDSAFIINTANATDAISFEEAVHRTVPRYGDVDGMLVATNSFLSPQWEVNPWKEGLHGGASLIRRQHLIELANPLKGSIDEAAMEYIMEQPLFYKNGTLADGATVLYEEKAQISVLTVYQVIAKPSELTWWVRVPTVNDWQEVNLKTYFSSN